jgi:hypothetical protein
VAGKGRMAEHSIHHPKVEGSIPEQKMAKKSFLSRLKCTRHQPHAFQMSHVFQWRHDIQPNDTKHEDIQPTTVELGDIKLTVVRQSVTFF